MGWVAPRRLVRCAALAALIGQAVGPAAGSAHAQEGERIEQANAAFSRGLALENGASFAEALAQFEAAAALAGREAPQTELHIGRCQSKLGLLADAKAHLVHAVELARASGAKHVEQAAHDELEQVTPRVPTLTLLKPVRANVTRVTIDERAVPTAMLGTPLPLNAVEHRIVVEFDAGAPMRRTIVLRESTNESIAIEPPDAAPAPAAATATAPIAAPAAGPSSGDVPSAAAEAPASHGRALGWGLVTGGAVAAAAGAVFWVLRANEISTLDSGCHSGICPAGLEPDYDRAKLYNGLGIALFATGGAALAAGGGVLLLGGGKSATATTVRLLPQAVEGGAGAMVGGSF